MERYYLNNETDEIESIETVRTDYYNVFGRDDYATFDEYLTACQWYNNGALTPVSVELRRVKRELNEKLILARKYGYEEYADELADLLEVMNVYSKYVRAERE